MPRKRYTKRQIVQYWEESNGRCWRCGEKIEGKPTPIYGVDWHLGHVGKAHWAGGVTVAPEHSSCNQTDAKVQTKAAAKAIRTRSSGIGVRKPSKFPNARTGKWKTKIGGRTELRKP